MPQTIQLELELELALESAFQDALEDPACADVIAIWDGFIQAIAQLPEDQQLKAAGKLVDQIAEVFQQRSHKMLDELEAETAPLEEPIIGNDLLADLFRHTMNLELDGFMEPFADGDAGADEPYQTQDEDSISAPIDKRNALNLADQIRAKNKALAVAHGENLQEWSAKVDRWRSRNPNKAVSFEELQKSVRIKPVKLLLALLLSPNPPHWEQHWTTAEEFYSTKSLRLVWD